MRKLGGRLNMADEHEADQHRQQHRWRCRAPRPRPGRARDRAGRWRAGVTTRAKSSSVPTTCTAMVMTRASSDQEHDAEGPHRHALGLGHLRVDRREDQRPGDDRQHDRQAGGEQRERHELLGGDGEQVAEQHVGDGAGVLGGQRAEQHAEAGGEGEDRAGGDLPAASTRLPRQPMARPPATQNTARPERDRHADQDAAGGAREADVGERVGGERVLAHDHEVAEQPGGEGDERAADEGVAHEAASAGRRTSWTGSRRAATHAAITVRSS